MRDVRPIRTEEDYAAAMAEIGRLWGAAAGTPEGDRLDVLATLVDAYEAERDPIDPPDPVAAIRFHMEQQGLTRKDLERMLGTRTRVSEILNRKRGLSIAIIRRLHADLGIAAEVLIRPTRTRQGRLRRELRAPRRQANKRAATRGTVPTGRQRWSRRCCRQGSRARARVRMRSSGTWLGHRYFLKAQSNSCFCFETLDPPGTFVPLHVHPQQDEFIYMLDGVFDLQLGENKLQARAGDLVRGCRGASRTPTTTTPHGQPGRCSGSARPASSRRCSTSCTI